MRLHQFFQILGWLTVTGFVVSAPAGARASEPSASELNVARRLFEEGAELARQGRWPEAAATFRKVIAIKDTPGVRFHLARCEEEQSRLVEALLEYDRAQELLGAGMKAPDVGNLLGPARARVQARVALLTLRVPPEVTSAGVEMDGIPLSPSVIGVPLPVNPGKHRLSAVAAGRVSQSVELELSAGESREFSFGLTATPRSAAPEPAQPARPAHLPARDAGASGGFPGRSVALVAEASLFVVGLGVGLASSVARASALDRLQLAEAKVSAQDASGSGCTPPAPVAGCAELAEARRDGSRASLLAATGFIGAGASAAAFGLTWWLWPERAAPAAELRAEIAPGAVRLAVSGRF